MKDKLKCMVTGGAGFIGSNLVDRLIDDGHEVHIVDNLSTGKIENINPKAKSTAILSRTMQIKFVAKVDDLLEWDFKTLQDTVDIKLGESKTISYEGKNLSNRIITSTANFIASPDSIVSKRFSHLLES